MKNNLTKQVIFSIVASVVLSFALFFAYLSFALPKESIAYDESGYLPKNYTVASKLYGPSDNPMIDFSKAAVAAVPAVTHIKTTFPKHVVKSNRGSSPFGNNDPFGDMFEGFFGFGPQIMPEQQASGSGVIISQDGYIVTNNHVITDEQGNVAKDIKVTLSNGQSYDASLIGNDPSSDIAVIKVNGKKLPYLVYGNSDYVSLGQWVLAVGYPLNLDATVTAGIVSAKSRALGINSEGNRGGAGKQSSVSAIESFIQTDAAVNRGNSGGALVNLQGEFIGVNSAIATPTGYYSGYSFAIPSNIVKKVADDIIKYGKAQRGYLGISFPNDQIPKEDRKKQDNYAEHGVYVGEVIEDGAAQKAGLKKGDIITKLDDKEVETGTELTARLAMYRPGGKVKITYKRSDKEAVAYAILKNSLGTYESTKKKSVKEEIGAEIEKISDAMRQKYEIRQGGLVVKKIDKNGLLGKTRMDEGFIILSVSGEVVDAVEDFYRILEENRGETLKIEGFYPNSEGLYAYPIKME